MFKLFSFLTIFSNKLVHILFLKLFTALGQCLVKNKINLIYGGGNVGLMGTVAKTVDDGGCQVTGFLPEFFVTRSKHSIFFVHNRYFTLFIVPSSKYKLILVTDYFEKLSVYIRTSKLTIAVS